MHNCAYIKTWIGEQAPQKGYESAGKPRGGGWGVVRNVTFSNFQVDGADGPPSITQDNGNTGGKYGGTSKMQVSNILFENFSGHLHGRSSATASVNCSKVKPCFDVVYRNMKLKPSKDADSFGTSRCRNVKPGGVRGLSGEGCK
jgi:galacturan 1,4-alpha-galacturonidase